MAKTLKPCNSHEVLREQLEIRVQTLLLLAIFVMLFFIIVFLVNGPTYGVL